jgi:vitamin B12/bleomycin/antimicrobial peptide transport system ATP-binding/permease protein
MTGTSMAIAIAGVGLLIASVVSGASISPLLPLATLLLAGVLYQSRSASTYVRALIGLVSVAHVVLAGSYLAALLGWLPASDTPPSATMAVAASIFAAILLAGSRIPVIRTVTALTDPYFEAREPGVLRVWPFGSIRMQERWIGLGLVAVVIAMQFALVAISVRFSYWNRDWFNAIQNKDAAEFWRLLLTVWVFWVVIGVSMAIYQYVLRQILEIRWRTWLTQHYTRKWLDGSTHYRMQLLGGQTDNPDQRIQEDVRRFTSYTLQLTLGILSQVSSLVSFSVILWTISGDFTLPGTDIVVPGLLFWIALVYASLSTYVTHLIGRQLIPLNFQQEQFEADFRFGLARLREYGEQVALLEGEGAERQRLSGMFGRVIENFYALVKYNKRLIAFTSFYDYSSSVVPYVIAAPFYFAGRIPLGGMTQTAGAFSRVEGALSYFITIYQTLAEYKAVIDRLTSFEDAMERARATGAVRPGIERVRGASRDLAIENLTVHLPDGRSIVRVGELALQPGETALLTGPSGSGKSTLFRAIAGIWPFGTGLIRLPGGESLMLLPQRPYIPIGTLRGAVAYPALEGSHDDNAITAALEAAKLGHLKGLLNEERAWAQTLSLGEQQRVAVARALLAKPDWLLLDEATAALDEPTEAQVYRVLRENLPDTTVVSIGHRSTLAAFHERRIDMRPIEDGLFTPHDARQAVAAQ